MARFSIPRKLLGVQGPLRPLFLTSAQLLCRIKYKSCLDITIFFPFPLSFPFFSFTIVLF